MVQLLASLYVDFIFFNQQEQPMTPLKKYIWLVDTVMKAGNVGLTLQQIADTYYFNDDINGGRLYSDRVSQIPMI